VKKGADLEAAIKGLEAKAAKAAIDLKAADDATHFEAQGKEAALGKAAAADRQRDALQGLVRDLERKTVEGSKVGKSHSARADDLERKLKAAERAAAETKQSLDEAHEAARNQAESTDNARKALEASSADKLRIEQEQAAVRVSKAKTETDEKEKTMLRVQQQLQTQLDMVSTDLTMQREYGEQSQEEISKLQARLDEEDVLKKQAADTLSKRGREATHLAAELAASKDAETRQAAAAFEGAEQATRLQEELENLAGERALLDVELERQRKVMGEVEKSNQAEREELVNKLQHTTAVSNRTQEEATRLATQLQVARSQLETEAESAASFSAKVQELAKSSAEQEQVRGRMEQKLVDYKGERSVLHKQLQEANSKLDMAADALTAAANQSSEMKGMEQRIRVMSAEREMDRVRALSMEAQLEQVAQGRDYETEQLTTRIASYERALFETRRSLAAKDSRISQLDGQLSKLTGVPSSGASYGSPAVRPSTSPVRSVPPPNDDSPERVGFQGAERESPLFSTSAFERRDPAEGAARSVAGPDLLMPAPRGDNASSRSSSLSSGLTGGFAADAAAQEEDFEIPGGQQEQYC